MSRSPSYSTTPPRRSSLAQSITPSSSPDLLPRYSNTTRHIESPNTIPSSTPEPSNDFPRFTSPFNRGESIDIGPPAKPFVASALPKRLSVSFTGDDRQRKPSVIDFHGDLKAEQNREQSHRQTLKSRRKFWMKALILSTLFVVGMMSGIAIGHWGVPYVTQKSSSVTSATCADDESLGLTTQKAKAAATYWQPTAGTTFQIQLSQALTSTTNLPANIQVYDVDLFDTPASTIAGLKAAGKKVVCYFSAGTAEDWRSDYSQFADADVGTDMADWPGEKWVYTPSATVRAIMVTRLQLAKTKGCDGVDPDNVDVYNIGSDSGFSDLTQATASDYLKFLADKAHGMGLAIGLKNAGAVIPAVLPYLQWVVTEQCVTYNECAIYKPFVTANKPVFNIHYPFASNNKITTVSATVKSKYCTGTSNISGFTNVLKHRSLDTWSYNC